MRQTTTEGFASPTTDNRLETTDNGQQTTEGFASATPDNGQRRAALRLRQTTRLLVNKTMSGGFAEDMPDNYVDL